MRIRLNTGHVALIDDEDAARVIAGHWYAHANGAGVIYVRGRVRQRRLVYLHRFVLGVTGAVQVDHINDDPLDCRKANLRVVTGRQNARRGRIAEGRSAYKGVSWAAHLGRWRVRMRTDTGRLSFGTYASEIDAARAYDAAARKHHGPFARLNFPD